jgi:hypothetical protein
MSTAAYKKLLEGWLNRYPKIAYIHVPKCAGVSAMNALFSAFYPRFLKASRAFGRIDLRASEKVEQLIGVEMMRGRESALILFLSEPMSRFVAAHVYARPAVVEAFSDWNFVTLLRDPIGRFVSSYVYNFHKTSDWKKVSEPIDSFLRTDRARSDALTYARYFSGMGETEILERPDEAVARSVENLSRFASVGFVDDLNGWADDVGRNLGRKPRIPSMNRSPMPDLSKKLQQSAEVTAVIRGMCEIDLRIYAAVRTAIRG